MTTTTSKPTMDSDPTLAPVERATSLFVNGRFPSRRARVVLFSVLAGFVLTVVWSAHFVDATIGDNVADTMLGHEARGVPIAGIASGVVFAFVTGLAGTFTACNVAVFSAICPMVGEERTRGNRLVATLRPVGWLSVGMVAVSAAYGALVGIVGTRLPQFSTAVASPGTLSPPLTQAVVVFGVIGIVMVYIGLAALGIVRDPFRRIAVRHPNAPMVFMGVLIGAFLLGRPFALFRQLFRDAAESHNPLYGAFAFSLQSIGNIAIMAALFTLLSYTLGGRMQRWLSARPERGAITIATAFIASGTFLVLYWDVRLLARLEIIPWYPTAPWT